MEVVNTLVGVDIKDTVATELPDFVIPRCTETAVRDEVLKDMPNFTPLGLTESMATVNFGMHIQ